MMDTLTMIVAAAAGFECVVGRIAAMALRRHRPLIQAGYLAAAIVCFGVMSMIMQGGDASVLDVAVWIVAAYLVATWGDWRTAPPLEAHRARPQRYKPGDLVPSSQFDDGRR